MNNINLEKQIIGLIPSQTIKNAIKENNHKFTDEEYVKIVIDFAKSWESRITLLIAQITSSFGQQPLILLPSVTKPHKEE